MALEIIFSKLTARQHLERGLEPQLYHGGVSRRCLLALLIRHRARYRHIHIIR